MINLIISEVWRFPYILVVIVGSLSRFDAEIVKEIGDFRLEKEVYILTWPADLVTTAPFLTDTALGYPLPATRYPIRYSLSAIRNRYPRYPLPCATLSPFHVT